MQLPPSSLPSPMPLTLPLAPISRALPPLVVPAIPPPTSSSTSRSTPSSPTSSRSTPSSPISEKVRHVRAAVDAADTDDRNTAPRSGPCRRLPDDMEKLRRPAWSGEPLPPRRWRGRDGSSVSSHQPPLLPPASPPRAASAAAAATAASTPLPLLCRAAVTERVPAEPHPLRSLQLPSRRGGGRGAPQSGEPPHRVALLHRRPPPLLSQSGDPGRGGEVPPSQSRPPTPPAPSWALDGPPAPPLPIAPAPPPPLPTPLPPVAFERAAPRPTADWRRRRRPRESGLDMPHRCDDRTQCRRPRPPSSTCADGGGGVRPPHIYTPDPSPTGGRLAPAVAAPSPRRRPPHRPRSGKRACDALGHRPRTRTKWVGLPPVTSHGVWRERIGRKRAWRGEGRIEGVGGGVGRAKPLLHAAARRRAGGGSTRRSRSTLKVGDRKVPAGGSPWQVDGGGGRAPTAAPPEIRPWRLAGADALATRLTHRSGSGSRGSRVWAAGTGRRASHDRPPSGTMRGRAEGGGRRMSARR